MGKPLPLMKKSKILKTTAGDTAAAEQSQRKISQVVGQMEQVIEDKKPAPLDIKSRVPSILPQSTVTQNETQSLKALATRFEESKDFEQSLSYYKLYIETSERLKEEEYNREIALLEQGNQIKNREKEIEILEQERELQQLKLAQNDEELAKQTRFRNSLFIGSLLIASLAIALYLYIGINARLMQHSLMPMMT